jgi:hypothetical protein
MDDFELLKRALGKRHQHILAAVDGLDDVTRFISRRVKGNHI